jgi:hypothetical protein
MAESPAHRFGQIIGESLELAIRPVLETVARDLKLFLDGKGERKIRGNKRKIAWIDGKGNSHDLDYVFESGGADGKIGLPRAFIEIAWRRYTKHSRNKAQEIQGAILPLAEHYGHCRPFLGVIFAGVFTDGSLKQLRSQGFTVLYFPYADIVNAFAVAGVDAEFDEDTPDRVLLRRVHQWEKLPAKKRESAAIHLRKYRKVELETFVSALRAALTRRVESIYVLPLHGMARTLGDVLAAIEYLQSHDESQPSLQFVRYEIGIRYSNGDEVRGQFKDKTTAIAFLRSVATDSNCVNP